MCFAFMYVCALVPVSRLLFSAQLVGNNTAKESLLLIKYLLQTRPCTLWVKCLPGKHEDRSSNP